MMLTIQNTCNNIELSSLLYTVKRVLTLIQIIAPILLLIMASVGIFNIVKNPDEKKGVKKLINKFIVTAIIFFIPVIVNAFMYMLGETTNFSSCWNNASNNSNGNTKYMEIEENGKRNQSIVSNTKDYEKGVPSKMDFSCKSSVVKAQFSCNTLKIVEKHLNDFDATNFKSVINNKYGSFDAYAKSLGGIFGEYYGKKIEGRTEKDFQMAAEYVLGWMYMYGWDYKSGSGTNNGAHVKWNGNDAFYVNGGFVGKYISDSDKQYTGMGTNFDDVISTKSQGGSTGRMASECGDLEVFVFNKLNINRNKQLSKVSRLKDLKVGDCLYFGNGPKWNKLDESNWTNAYGAHNVIVGEVYDDHVVIYDGGSYYPTHNNYKRNLYFPAEDTEAADDAEVKKVFGYTSWGIRRWYNFKK